MIGFIFGYMLGSSDNDCSSSGRGGNVVNLTRRLNRIAKKINEIHKQKNKPLL